MESSSFKLLDSKLIIYTYLMNFLKQYKIGLKLLSLIKLVTYTLTPSQFACMSINSTGILSLINWETELFCLLKLEHVEKYAYF